MEVLHITLTSIGSIIALFILTKFLGYKQMSQLSMFDYVNGITIGSIAAEMATSLEDDFLKPLTAMVIYAIFGILFSKLAEKSIFARRIIIGKPSILYHNGELYYKNLQKANIDVNEFLTQCRVGGYFDLSDLQCAVLEPNGRISFLPKSDTRPLTPKDMQLSPQQEMLVANVIIDGHIMYENLRHTGHDEAWLKNQIKAHGASGVQDVLLATCDIYNTVAVYRKIYDKNKLDILN